MTDKPDFGDLSGDDGSTVSTTSSSSSSGGGSSRSAVQFQGELGSELHRADSTCERCGSQAHGVTGDGWRSSEEVLTGVSLCQEHFGEEVSEQLKFGLEPEVELFEDY